MDKQVAITGYGWLGQLLAAHLTANGYSVHATTTTPAKLPAMQQNGVTGHVYKLGEALPAGYTQIPVHILCIPPGKAGGDYAMLVKAFVQQLAPGALVIFISSTGVYPEATVTYTENSIIKLSMLASAEAVIRKTRPRHFILRCGGLIGPGRNPGTFLAGKTGLKGAGATVNLVHAHDICDIVSHLLTDTHYGTYNLCLEAPLDKKAFYTRTATLLNLLPPMFVDSDDVYRIIDCSRITNLTGTRFKHTRDFYLSI